mmetsp:Transcript_28596/g.57787  ORF Transcript_28596/g.57787 Transcript_28596/m.57787 type:complete len:296 (-) Transcript_28596:290-1177(-)
MQTRQQPGHQLPLPRPGIQPQTHRPLDHLGMVLPTLQLVDASDHFVHIGGIEVLPNDIGNAQFEFRESEKRSVNGRGGRGGRGFLSAVPRFFGEMGGGREEEGRGGGVFLGNVEGVVLVEMGGVEHGGGVVRSVHGVFGEGGPFAFAGASVFFVAGVVVFGARGGGVGFLAGDVAAGGAFGGVFGFVGGGVGGVVGGALLDFFGEGGDAFAGGVVDFAHGIYRDFRSLCKFRHVDVDVDVNDYAVGENTAVDTDRMLSSGKVALDSVFLEGEEACVVRRYSPGQIPIGGDGTNER